MDTHSFRSLTVACAVGVGLLPAATAHAEPLELAVQGRMVAAGGVAADGKYPLGFALYDDPVAGTKVYSELFLAVAVQSGLFAVNVGSTIKLDSALFASGKPLYLGVTVADDPELPRQLVRRVPMAVHALVASAAQDLQCTGCVGPEDLAKGAVTGEKIANGAVGANHVSFAWAAADGPGGSATFALAANTAKQAEAAKNADFAQFADEAGNAKTAKAADTAKAAETAKLADLAKGLQCTGCVVTAQLANDAVTADQLAAKAVTSAKIADGAVLAKQIGEPCKVGEVLQMTAKGWACAATFTGVCAPGTCPANPAASCRALKDVWGITTSGPYWVTVSAKPGAAPAQVQCDMQTDGGGWTRCLYQLRETNGGAVRTTTGINIATKHIGTADDPIASRAFVASSCARGVPVEVRVLAQKDGVTSNHVKWLGASEEFAVDQPQYCAMTRPGFTNLEVGYTYSNFDDMRACVGCGTHCNTGGGSSTTSFWAGNSGGEAHHFEYSYHTTTQYNRIGTSDNANTNKLELSIWFREPAAGGALGTFGNPAQSCRQIRQSDPKAADGAYFLDPTGYGAYPAFCDMTDDGGGWTLVLKTDSSSAAHYAAASVKPSRLSDKGVDTVAKFTDTFILALQQAGGVNHELRVTSPDFTAQQPRYFAKNLLWFMSKPGSLTAPSVKISAAAPYSPGGVCYDGDAPCGGDHWCFFYGPSDTAKEHVCIRRFNTPGIWLNGGAYSPGTYKKALLWVR